MSRIARFESRIASNSKQPENLRSDKILGPAFGRTDFSRISIFEPPDFFADFLAGFFLIFVGKSAQKKSSRKIPGKILQNLYNKNPPTHFCRLAGAKNSKALTAFRTVFWPCDSNRAIWNRSFSAIAVFLCPLANVLKILRSLGKKKEREICQWTTLIWHPGGSRPTRKEVGQQQGPCI